MDILSLLGIFIALSAIIGGNWLDGGHLSSLIQVTAMIIVLGGTLGAIMVQTPLETFLRAIRISTWVFKPKKIRHSDLSNHIMHWSAIARREGLLGLEAIADDETDDFTRKGLQLLVDGTDPEAIRDILEVDNESREYMDLQAAKVFEGMGGYCPTIGIIGAVLGLIHVMNNLSDPSKLGDGIATAFVATVYGVGLANLFFLPMANKLKNIIRNQYRLREMVLEGVISIGLGENPRNIEIKLNGYFPWKN
ncbi:MAG: flagellar motor protein [Gammaproteobacteria bacterium]